MDNLPKEFRHALSERGQTRNLQKGEPLIVAGDTDKDVYLVNSGRLRVSLLSRRGREPLLADLDAGHLVGELAPIDGQPRSATVVALEPSCVTRVDGKGFLDLLLSRPEWALWMLRALSARSRSLTDRHFAFATLSVHGRVLSEIARIVHLRRNGDAQNCDTNSDRIQITDFPTHEDLAAKIGAQREAVTRSLRVLTHEGILTQRRRLLDVKSVERLQESLEAEGGEWPRG